MFQPDKLADHLVYDPATGIVRRRVNGELEIVGNPNGEGHLRFRFFGKELYAHRVAWELANGPIPAGHMIDHVNRNKSDNRISNLRLATRSQNAANSAVTRNKQFRGVYKRREYRRRPFSAEISVGNKMRRLGYFATAHEAAAAYDRAASKTHGAFAILNFPLHEVGHVS